MFDIGMIWLIVLGLYTIVPVGTWLALGAEYSSPLNGRLYYISPTKEEYLYITQISLAYCVSFTLLYYFLRVKSNSIKTRNLIPYIPDRALFASLFIIIGIKLFNFTLQFSGVIAKPESYVDQYLVVQELPIILRQILNFNITLNSIATIVLVTALLQRWPDSKFIILIYILILFIGIDADGGRASIIVGLFTLILTWHIFVRKIPTLTWSVVGTLGLALFTIWGIRRGLKSWEAVGTKGFKTVDMGEFDSIIGNAVDLVQKIQEKSISIPFQARYGEFWSFIPSQLLPFEKMDMANWYLNAFYKDYKAIGGGWAFGAMSQAVVGGGIIEACIRGLMLALLYFLLVRWYKSAKSQWWIFPLYLYLLVYTFMSFRDTTFQQIGPFLQFALPSMFLIWLLSLVLSIAKSDPNPNSQIEPKAV
ncbi:MAG TPA: hypothetical protein PK006_04205 [Saprospiraceae bacterium]|nr:hypothetical protein [Saprospiraceae bacterium]